VILSQVATSDITKLTRILDPSPNPADNRVLDYLLKLAVQEVSNGNAERAVGYLADYATRDPRRAEALPFQPELEPVRDKIDSMVSRMATVARMSAEDGLSRAEQAASDASGKLSNWDTSADVLVKLAHRLFEAGGYANYSRSAELAKAVSDAGAQSKPADQALAAAASASVSAAVAGQNVNEMLPGINVPYWVPQEFQVNRVNSSRRPSDTRPYKAGSLADIRQNWRALKEVSAHAISQLWSRAPILVMLLGWFFGGLGGGVAFAIGSKIWPDSLFVMVGNLAFTLWSLGFLAIVGFGFYARIRYTPPRR
jgi:hypothetical protein